VEDEPPHRAVYPVRPDHKVVVTSGAVAELDRDLPVVFDERVEVGPHSERNLSRPIEEDGVQIRAMERDAGPDTVPQLGDIDLGE
jgi:hypothetical protein